jgi:hypothetical protein
LSATTVTLAAMTNSLEPSSSFTTSEPTVKASWHWRFEDSSGTEVQLPEGGAASGVTGFPSQSDAESWVGEVWHDLLDDGVDQVTLFEADREVYGPMSLHADASGG